MRYAAAFKKFRHTSRQVYLKVWLDGKPACAHRVPLSDLATPHGKNAFGWPILRRSRRVGSFSLRGWPILRRSRRVESFSYPSPNFYSLVGRWLGGRSQRRRDASTGRRGIECWVSSGKKNRSGKRLFPSGPSLAKWEILCDRELGRADCFPFEEFSVGREAESFQHAGLHLLG